jgi:hypothetical protein
MMNLVERAKLIEHAPECRADIMHILMAFVMEPITQATLYQVHQLIDAVTHPELKPFVQIGEYIMHDSLQVSFHHRVTNEDLSPFFMTSRASNWDLPIADNARYFLVGRDSPELNACRDSAIAGSMKQEVSNQRQII